VMTRAAERLVVCGTRGKNKIPDGCWYQLVDDALRPTSVGDKADDGGGEILRFRKQNTEPAEPQKNILPAAIKPTTAPAWLTSDVSNATSAMSTITPSNAEEDDARVPASGGRGAALLRGSLVHRLMQSLPDIPAANRRKAADDYLARAGAKLDTAERIKLAEQVMLVLQDPHFYELYGAGSRAEVPIVGRLQFGDKTARVSGQIDRLAVTQGSVLIADFKTNRPAPRRIEDVPLAYVTQLALYRTVLKNLYPGKTVRAALLWIEVPDLMELSAEALDAALARVTSA
jgi:ATP-dependent helicase/nuclease subunit A